MIVAQILANSTLNFPSNFDIDLLLSIKKISSVHWLVSPILTDATVYQWKHKKLIYYCGRHWKTFTKDDFRWEVKGQNGYSIRFSHRKDRQYGSGITSYETLVA